MVAAQWLAVVTTSIGGFYMVWTRGTVADLITDLGISLDAIWLSFALLWPCAMRWLAGFGEHRRWACLFMPASAVRVLSVGLMGWQCSPAESY
ncbi:MAG: hypothetical protein U5K38_10455 [Woeseiaceae bacterium]|nr:hypothetical protein [Woeseiaceae bacterium]